MRIGGTGRYLLVGLLVTACASSAPRDQDDGRENPTPEPEPTIGKYEQTWDTPYGDTTCGDWHAEMDDHQHFVMAGDMFVNLWRDGGSDAFPEDDVIDRYVNGIGIACDGAGEDLELKVPEVAVLLYNTASDVQPPD